MPQGTLEISSLTRESTGDPCIARWTLNHWTTREVPAGDILEPHSPHFISGLNLALAEVSPDEALYPLLSSAAPLWIRAPSEQIHTQI